MANKLSVVVPIFNEQLIIDELYKRLKKSLDPLNISHEIIFINDGSSDNSLNILKKLAKNSNQVKVISFSRNFGHMSSVNAGLLASSGQYVVIMDGDLQDPPEIIPKLLQKAKEGFDVVFAVKKKRKENILRRVLFRSFYRILNSISQFKMPLDAGTFSLLNRKVADILIKLPERNKYFSGLRSWVGFKQTGIIYEREPRFAGQPASFSRLFKLALDGMLSFSYIPLRLASFLGFIFATVAFGLILLVILLRIFLGFGIVGWASTMSTVLLMGGVQLITLGIIGEYLARIYDEVKNRPEYIISEKINL